MKAQTLWVFFLCLSLLGSQQARAEASPDSQHSDGLSSASFQTTTSSAPTVIAFSAGGFHTCAVTSDGKVWCWGNGGAGQLGNGFTPLMQRFPVEVVGLSAPAIGVSAGYLHTCALLNNGAVQCWGWNPNGQLGDGTTTNRIRPVNVFGLNSGVTAISAGVVTTCALAAGGVLCWGANYAGAVGDGTNIDRLTPVSVVGLGPGSVSTLSVGENYACVRTTSGGAACWGSNYYNTLGNPSSLLASNVPTPVVGMGAGSGVVSVAAGLVHHVCAITGTVGAVMCWGRNFEGQLGTGNLYSSAVPTNVVGLTGVVAVSTGGYHTCALTASGGVKCWGRNTNGEVGNGTTGFTHPTPADVVGLSSGVIAIDAGFSHTCALLNNGRLKCWGGDNYGQRGALYPQDYTVPTEVIWLFPRARMPIVSSWREGD
ncbi:MAG: hypothetical protein NZ693_08065 [Thermoflexales bacterium]|nr:hypothetical protein [Thermoflexales bacterium]